MIRHLILAMDYNHTFRFLLEPVKPIQQPVHVRMSADSSQNLNLRIHGDIFPEQLHTLGALNQLAPQSPHSLIPHETDGTLGTPQIMFQMVPDTSRLAHTGRRQDYFRFLIEINHP